MGCNERNSNELTPPATIVMQERASIVCNGRKIEDDSPDRNCAARQGRKRKSLKELSPRPKLQCNIALQWSERHKFLNYSYGQAKKYAARVGSTGFQWVDA